MRTLLFLSTSIILLFDCTSKLPMASNSLTLDSCKLVDAIIDPTSYPDYTPYMEEFFNSKNEYDILHISSKWNDPKIHFFRVSKMQAQLIQVKDSSTNTSTSFFLSKQKSNMLDSLIQIVDEGSYIQTCQNITASHWLLNSYFINRGGKVLFMYDTTPSSHNSLKQEDKQKIKTAIDIITILHDLEKLGKQ